MTACALACTAAVPEAGTVNAPVAFAAVVTAQYCAGAPTFAWTFGDGGTSSEQNPSHTYASAGVYSWALVVTVEGIACPRSGTVTIRPLPGDCDGDGIVSLGEVQRAINMFLEIEPVACEVDGSGDGTVSIGEVQRVINAYLPPPPSPPPPGIPSGATPEVEMGTAWGNPGDTVTVPVRLSTNGAEVTAASYRISYDPNFLTFAGALPGTVGGKEVQSSLDSTRQVVSLAVYGFNACRISDEGAVVIANVRFTIRPGAVGTTALAGSCGATNANGVDYTPACGDGLVASGGYSIGGRVTLNGSPLAGVTVSTGSQSARTAADGSYLIGGYGNGTYVVSASKPGYIFSPAQSVIISNANVPGVDFTATENFTLHGNVSYVEQGTRIGVPGVTITATRTGGETYTATTEPYFMSAGDFSLTGLASGSYSVTASKPDNTFSPASYAPVSLSRISPAAGINFEATSSRLFSISGAVTQGGVGLPGVSLTLHGWPRTFLTQPGGQYSFGSLPGGMRYEVDPQMNCKRFTPAYLTVPNLSADAENVSFAAADVVMCTPCYDALDRDISICEGLWNPDLCTRQARTLFSNCLHQATMQINSPLHGATLLAISVSRHTGQPTPESVSLTIAEEGDYFINVVNGDQVNRETMASSATVDLSPVGRIFYPDEIKWRDPFLVKSVHLTPGEYTLTVEVRSNPGAYLAIVVSNLDFETLPFEEE